MILAVRPGNRFRPAQQPGTGSDRDTMLRLHPQCSQRVRWLVAAAMVLLALLPGRRVEAQLLRVQAVEAVSGRPASGAIVDVIDSADHVAAQVVLGADGRREIILVRPGTFRVRIRRIGYPPYLSDAVAVGTAPVDLALTVPARRVTLAAVEVTAARCAGDAFTDPGVAALWDEIHKALTSTGLGRDDPSTTFETRSFRRTVGRDGRVRAVEVGLPRTKVTSRPYLAVAAGDLASRGYVQPQAADSTLLFHGPDEDVLRSPEFIATHCFSIVRGTDATTGLLGLRFVPAQQRDRREVNDIAGTLWIDPTTAELRHVDFHYVSPHLPRAAQGEGASGGQVVFQRLASGRWIVGAWKLRMPRFATVRRRRQPAIDGFEEYGGLITPRADDSVGAPAAFDAYRTLLTPGVLAGTVFDSLAMRPLAGARVWVVPIEPPSVVKDGLSTPGQLAVAPTPIDADADGRWHLRGVAPGTYRVGFEHPAIDSLGLALRWPELRVAPDDQLQLVLSTPSLPTLTGDCAAMPGATPADTGVLIGVVRGVAGGRPPQGAIVRATWQEWSPATRDALRAVVLEANGRAAPDGSYRLCGVPRGVPLDVRANTQTDTTPARTVQVPATGLARQNLEFVPTPDSAGAPVALTADTANDEPARQAATNPAGDLARVHWRRLGGRGALLTGDALHRHVTLPSALRALPGVRPSSDQRIGGPWIVMLPREGGECRARVFVDGSEVEASQIQSLRPATLAAIEVFTDPARAPVYTSVVSSVAPESSCGVVLLWT